MSAVGINVPRADGSSNLRGDAQYVDDIQPDGCMVGATGRSPRVHPKTIVRLALGFVAAVPTRLSTSESALIGYAVNSRAVQSIHDDIAPIDDIHLTGKYRRSVAQRVVRSWIAREAKES